MRFIAAIVILSLLGLCQAEGEATSSARLLVEKQIPERFLVENKDFIVNYIIYNVGESPAVDVAVKDVSLPEEYFQLISGESSFNVKRVEAGENVNRTVVYRPKVGVWGLYNFTAAEVNYSPREEANNIRIGYSSEPGEMYILSAKEYERRFSFHILDWIAFAVMSMPTLVIPFYLYWKSKSKYEAIAAAKQDVKTAKTN